MKIEINSIKFNLEIIPHHINLDSRFKAMRVYNDEIDITVPTIKSKMRTKNILLSIIKQLTDYMKPDSKYDIWKKDYEDIVSWEEFDSWSYCKYCKSYSEDNCICYKDR